jgi:DNA (cytosine-5)-methyltransferase 1
MNEKFRVLDLFSGIGGFSLGLERTGGFETVAFCENNRFCQQVLAKHWPGIPLHPDVETLEPIRGSADVVVGGFPCQDVSRAGKRAGLSGERSGLYRELVRALRLVRPKHAIVENVAALLADGMGTVLGDMAESGFDLEWDCVPACTLGAPHERDRVYIVAHSADADSERCREAGGLRHRQVEVSTGRVETASRAASNADKRIGKNGWPQRLRRRRPSAEEGDCTRADTYAPSVGCRPGRSGRPPDSFARVRDEARRNAANPYGARLAFGSGVGRDPRAEQPPAERATVEDGGQSIWPDEPALLGVDDGIPDRVERTKALGNTIIPKIPELIGRAILEAAA